MYIAFGSMGQLSELSALQKRRALGEGGRALEVNASHAGASVARHVPNFRPHEVHRVHLIYP